MKRRHVVAALGGAAVCLTAGAHTGPLPGAARQHERRALLRQAEAALQRLDTGAAEHALELAGNLAHEADTEILLLRTCMQQGQYRKALAFAAHTAGVHQDEVGGTLLYAWLLHLGGQRDAAQRLLARLQAGARGQRLVRDTRALLASDAPVVGAALLQPPLRLAPFAQRLPGSEQAAVLGTATLVRGGRFALAPAQVLGAQARGWVRNGLGQMRAARVVGQAAHRLVLLELAHPLPDARAVGVPRDMFPGAPGYLAGYTAHRGGAPAWPLLRPGFLGAAQDDGTRALGVAVPARQPLGGPLYDAAGRVAGVAVAGPGGGQLVPASRLAGAFGADLFAAPAAGVGAGAAASAGADAIYELALVQALQIMGRR
ncbi:MAG: hypothetical protein KF796_06835 [Ramlibacter sp.]|nr:hypothetical protein [Ramlibacter sp.]